MNRILYLFRRAWTECVIQAYSLFYFLPWGRAYITLALQKYVESDWYKERIKIFRKREVIEMYFERDESWFFKRRITWREKLGIFLFPFCYPTKARRVLEENNLLDYL